MAFVHLVARAKAGRRPFEDPAAAWWFWWRLRQKFPNVAAACLMPNHLHLLVRSNKPGVDRRRLGALLSGFSRHLEQRSLWQKVPLPARIPDRKHLLRQVRYVHLNPCREGLVDDPLRWPWSTHRGVLGAEMDPWVTPAALAGALGRARRGFGAWLHHYVSSDPSVSVSGTPPPAVLEGLLERRPGTPAEQSAEVAVAGRSSLVEELPGAEVVVAAQHLASQVRTLQQGVLAAVSAAPCPWLTRRCRRSIVAVITSAAAANAEVAAVLGVSRRRVQQLRNDPISPTDHACVLRCFTDQRLRFDEHVAWPLVHMAGLRLPR